MGKCSYHMIAYTLILMKMEHEILLDIPIPTFRQDHIRSLFEEELPQCFALIASRLEQQHVNEIQHLDKDLLTFIEEHIGDQQLCVSIITDRFHISAPTLQKRMNCCVGKTFSAYMEELRMKKGHRLLCDTDDSIQQIAEAVGYINANSFYKAYKRCYGISPRLARQNKNT